MTREEELSPLQPTTSPMPPPPPTPLPQMVLPLVTALVMVPVPPTACAAERSLHEAPRQEP